MPQEPQFGVPLAGKDHRDRPAAFGVLEKVGQIAFVRITLGDGTPPFIDLPGGALDAGETEQDAVIREFSEETGLAVEAGAAIGKAAQFFVTAKGEPVNNRCAFFVMAPGAGGATKIEDDHELVWLSFEEGLANLRHDAHAWALTAWRRRTARQV
jgi:8-oxo-dGTP diphosphatase